MNIFRLIIVKIKIFITLNYSYRKSNTHKRIKAILPPHLKIGEGLVIEENVTFSSDISSIGDYTYIGKNTSIDSCLSIGKFCSISREVRIGLISHPLNYISTSPVFYSPRRGWVKQSTYNENINGLTIIGNDVLISASTLILAGVKIGNGAVIGAGSFVNKDIPPYAIVAGIPAKIIKYRFNEEEISALNIIKWWDMSKEELMKYEKYFNSPISFIEALNNKNN